MVKLKNTVCTYYAIHLDALLKHCVTLLRSADGFDTKTGVTVCPLVDILHKHNTHSS